MVLSTKSGAKAGVAAVLLCVLAVWIAGCDEEDENEMSVLSGSYGDYTTPKAWTTDTTLTTSQFVTAGPTGQPISENKNPDYNVFFDRRPVVVARNLCQGTKCRLRGPNNIASVTMEENTEQAGSFVPIRVTVEKLHYNSTVDGVGWNIRPSHLQDEGVVADVDSTSLATSGLLTFTVTAPCQLSVELGSEDIMFQDKAHYWSFSNLIVAANPPESSWPRQKPGLGVDPETGDLTCTSARSGRACIIASADADCGITQVEANTDLYFTSSFNKTYMWGDGCGLSPKRIILKKGSSVFLDEDVVVYALISSWQQKTGVFGYGIISNYYMMGVKDNEAQSNVIALGKKSWVYGVIVMDSTYRNIKVGGESTVAWTKSFAWEGETDGVSLGSSHCEVHDNFFKVNDDVLKAFTRYTVFRNNVIWHQTIGRALMLSWGNEGENRVDRNGTTQILRTSIIHDYRAFERLRWSGSHPNKLGRIKSLIMWAALISAQHSMHNALGDAGSPILIKDLYVESMVGVLLSVTTGYWRLGHAAAWQATASPPQCGGSVFVKFDNLDLSRVRRIQHDSAAGGCDLDDEYSGIANANCLCTTARSCRAQSQCQVQLDFLNLKDSETADVPKLADALHMGANTEVKGLTDTGELLI